MTNPLTNIQNFKTLEFNYATLSLEGYANEPSYSSKLLKEVIEKLNSKDFPEDKRTVDRYIGRKGSSKRLLVHVSSPMASATRCFGRIALIKDKAPFLWSGKDIIEEIEKSANKKFIEITNYVINFNTNSDPVIMFEFNHSGPRLSDLEYYFRQVCKNFKIARSISTAILLDIDYADLSKNIENVFGVTVKVKSNALKKSTGNDWHKPLQLLKDEAGFRDVRLQLFYKRVKNPNKGNAIDKNIKGLEFARSIIDWLKKSYENIEKVEDLKMKYQVTGSDEIIDLDFLKNKTTSKVRIPINDRGLNTNIDFKHAVGLEFNHYLATGTTHND